MDPWGQTLVRTPWSGLVVVEKNGIDPPNSTFTFMAAVLGHERNWEICWPGFSPLFTGQILLRVHCGPNGGRRVATRVTEMLKDHWFYLKFPLVWLMI